MPVKFEKSVRRLFCLERLPSSRRVKEQDTLSAKAIRLARLFTPEYVRRINAKLVHPATSCVVKPNELESALARPLNVSAYEPDRSSTYLAATLSYGIITGYPFMDGNKRTAFVLANQYLRAQDLPGFAPGATSEATDAYQKLLNIADKHIDTAAGKLNVEDLSSAIQSQVKEEETQ